MKTKVSNYVKANRNGSRLAEFEINNTGWNAKSKKHKTVKDYSRLEKYKINQNNFSDEND